MISVAEAPKGPYCRDRRRQGAQGHVAVIGLGKAHKACCRDHDREAPKGRVGVISAGKPPKAVLE
jgi:hypothetical protein